MADQAKRLHVFAYDIADDRRRNKVAELLSQHAARVQHSVFEVVATPSEARSLVTRVKTLLLVGDKLRVYPVRLGDTDGVQAFGGGPLPEASGIWIL